ncbi:hypothetical protein BJV82DRAFT_573692 [Fennellomyces sp. T-0311]|nr:hypothetical protein BJV82DRAFT_573692 [Fennellomyces sp. T-0311]
MAGETTNDSPASLKQILEQSKLIATKVQQFELPQIERGLDQIDAQTHNLNSKTSQGQDQNVDIRAHYFLSKARVNTQVLLRDLGTIHLGAAPEHRQPIYDTDVEGYLARERTQTVIDVLADGQQEILEDIDHQFDQDLYGTWRGLREKMCSGYNLDEATQTEVIRMNLSKSNLKT